MSITVKEYFALAGSGFSHTDAKAIGPVLGELQKEGVVTPAGVVSAAHSTNSPLHSYFEWNDAKAANNFREDQASKMLQSIRVRFVADRREFATRAHKIEVTPREPERERKTYAVNGDSLEKLAAPAIRDLDAWCIKYAPQIIAFGKFAEVFIQVQNQIGEFREDFENGNLSGQFRRMMSEFFAWHSLFSKEAVAGRLLGEHMIYMNDAIAEAKAAFVSSGYLIERQEESDAA